MARILVASGQSQILGRRASASGPTTAPALAGGITASKLVAYWQPKGAASLAASYVNLANPGTNDAAPGVAPTFNTATGWTGTGTQYLTTGLVVGSGYSIVISYASLTNDGYLAGASSASYTRFYIYVDTASVDYGYGSGGNSATPTLTGGVLANTSAKGYRNGTADKTIVTSWSGTPTQGLYLMARNVNGSVSGIAACVIKACAVYNTTLLDAEVAAVSAAFAAL